LKANLNQIIASTLNLPLASVTNQLTMTEVESWDSLQHMTLIASLEQSFATEFTFEEIIAMQSVAEIKRVLNSKGADV
jgi:acyl carrier protein